MGRPPCCDKDGIKKGPWTPEEDIILVSYIQEHGPGNWRSVPTNTGLQRCSKSCRLRWTNYLRPGIKRGNFTPHEEGMIIHLQALLGNKWAAIASYLPQRTDNDIKNYWNTHLKKKLKRFQSSTLQQDPQTTQSSSSSSSNLIAIINNDQFSTKRSYTPNVLRGPTLPPLPPSTCYASSTENISRLLENWMKCSPTSKSKISGKENDNNNHHNDNITAATAHGNREGLIFGNEGGHFETILSFDKLDNDKVTASTITTTTTCDDSMEEDVLEGEIVHEMNNNVDDENNNPPLTFLEKWLLDETTTSRHVVEEILQLPSIF